MKPQDYKNHIRYYPAHHFLFYPIVMVLLFLTVRGATRDVEHRTEWVIASVMVFLLGWLSFMVRQHYALNNQNRIVRLEMRLRYYQLTQKRLETLEGKLEFGQIAALRFASDEELPALVDRTLKENLSPDNIKKSIVNWVADDMRV